MMGALVINPDEEEAHRDFEIALDHDVAGAATQSANTAAFLSRVAEYMRKGQAVPTVLANIVAQAFEDAAAEQQPNRQLQVLAQRLALTRKNRPLKHHPAKIRGAVLSLIKQGLTETKAVNKAAVDMKVSNTTVWVTWRAFRNAAQKDLGFLPWDDKRQVKKQRRGV